MPATSRSSHRVYRTIAWVVVASLYPLRLYAHLTLRAPQHAPARITFLETTYGREAPAMRRRA
jgi:hypothetical protein